MGYIGNFPAASQYVDVTWQSVKTSGFTAVSGYGYPCNTTSAAFTVTLPASPVAGDTIQLVDYAGTFDTNALTINPNGNKIESGTSNLQLKGEREGATLVYVDSTQGWLATSGINEGTDALEPPTYSIDYLVVAGGAGGGGAAGNSGTPAAGGGAGGMKTGTETFSVGTVYTITVGDGGAGQTSSNNVLGNNGSSSSISGTGLTTISTSGGGGGGTGGVSSANGANGGSGGGAGPGGTYGTGTSGEGNNGGTANAPACGGGGGKGSVGGNASSSTVSGNGGSGQSSSITGSSVTYAGGGGGGGGAGNTEGSGGSGGGGAGGTGSYGGPGTGGTNGTANTGGGGGGGAPNGASSYTSSSGGKGVVILRMLTANYTGTTTGSPTVATDGSYKVLTYTGTGSYTA